MNRLFTWIRGYVPPIFLAMLVASFILWYIAKLSYTYTTGQDVPINIDGQKFEVTCVIEGLGTNLFGYKVYGNTRIRVPLKELDFTVSEQVGHEGQLIISPQSLQSAIAVHYSDIKVISIGSVPLILDPRKND